MLLILLILNEILIVFLEHAQTAAVVILVHNQPSTYLIPATSSEDLLERLEDYELGLLVKERAVEKPRAIEVSIDDL